MIKTLLFAGSALAGLVSAPALAADCSATGTRSLEIGRVDTVAEGEAGKFALTLEAGEGIAIDLFDPAQAASSDSSEAGAAGAPAGLVLCGADGIRIAPGAADVFASGGSVMATPEGMRLRFAAPASGRYLVAVAPGSGREILVRRREVAAGSRSITPLALGASDFAKVSGGMPLLYSFTGRAGQWVELKANSANDTVINLAAPTGDGSYELIGRADDNDGLNPILRRKLPTSGTYVFQVEALSGEPDDVTVMASTTAAPPPPPAPAALRSGSEVRGTLGSTDERKVYAVNLAAGRSYRLELTAPYDAVLEIGTEDLLEPDSGDGSAGGFTAMRTQDANLTGTERLSFTARRSGPLLVQVRAYGVGEEGGGYILKLTEAGG